MKRFPLAFQIWLVFAGVTLGVFLLLITFLPWTLRSFFTQQLYDMLETSQNNLSLERAEQLLSKLDAKRPELEERPKLRRPLDFPAGGLRVKHLVLPQEPDKLGKQGMPLFYQRPFIKAIWQEAREQKTVRQRYSRDLGGTTVFYIIRKERVQEQPVYLISFAWDSYRNRLVDTMFWRLTWLVFLIFLLSWLPAAFWLARYLSKPLVQMERHIEQIAKGNWDEPFVLERKDEIGRLAQSFENMRRRLIRQDQAQQAFLQNASHDLKTPVMVIRSFIQSIQDGLLPKGTIEASLAVIDSEAQRLEKRIRNLLYSNKINYLKGRDLQLESFDLAEVIKKQVERIRWRNPELNWQVNLPALMMQGDREQWEIALENLLDNQIRYASQEISITQVKNQSEGKTTVIRFWNDGPPIDPQLVDKIFERYSAGQGGEFGLGLAIVYHILHIHGAQIWVRNEEGVAFYLQITLAAN